MAAIVLVIDHDHRRIENGALLDRVVPDHGARCDVPDDYLERDHPEFADEHMCRIDHADEVGLHTMLLQVPEEERRDPGVQASFLREKVLLSPVERGNVIPELKKKFARIAGPKHGFRLS